MTDDLYPGPTDEVPSEARAKEMAAADARDAVERVRRWDGEQAAMPLTSEYGDSWFQLRQQNSRVDWPEPLRTIYLDAFRHYLTAENVAYVLDATLRAYVVDGERWERNPDADAGWTPRDD